MSGVFGLGSMMLSCFGRLGRCKRPTCWSALLSQPARHALWVGSSYGGTRNRHPPTGHTPLVTVDKYKDTDGGCGAFWLPGMGRSNSAYLLAIPAWQSQGVTADFWYPSMRRVAPANVAQRRPNKLSRLRPRHRSQTHENGVTPGWWNP